VLEWTEHCGGVHPVRVLFVSTLSCQPFELCGVWTYLVDDDSFQSLSRGKEAFSDSGDS
jgi:hypothetical protein